MAEPLQQPEYRVDAPAPARQALYRDPIAGYVSEGVHLRCGAAAAGTAMCDRPDLHRRFVGLGVHRGYG